MKQLSSFTITIFQTNIFLTKHRKCLAKFCTKYCATYTTFSSRNVLFSIFVRLLMWPKFSRIFFLRHFFHPNTLKTKKNFMWGMNERFKYAEFYVFISFVGLYIYTVWILRILPFSCYTCSLTWSYWYLSPCKNHHKERFRFVCQRYIKSTSYNELGELSNNLRYNISF